MNIFPDKLIIFKITVDWFFKSLCYNHGRIIEQTVLEETIQNENLFSVR